MKYFLISLFFVILNCKEVTISNSIPRRDNNGNLMDIHDGTLI